MDPSESSTPASELPGLDAFRARLDTSFALAAERLELRLVELSEIGGPPKPGGRAKRQAFSLMFKGPAQPVLGQGIRSLAHPDLGEHEVFLVPVGDDEDGSMLYEAVFT